MIPPEHSTHLFGLAEVAKQSVEKEGFLAWRYNTIGVSDGMTQGHSGMRYSLQSREIIADSIETVTGAQAHDGCVAIPGCDKNMPGITMGIAKHNRPSVVIYGGTQRAGYSKTMKKLIDINTLYEAKGAYLFGTLGTWSDGSCSPEEILSDIERNAVPGPGACGGMDTANSLATIIEVLGFSLPGSSSALDAGAHGLMVPLLRSVEEAEQVVQYTKFPPQGIRGLGSPFATHAFRGQPTINSVEYFRQASQSLLTVIQIKVAKALECVEEIAKVPRVNVLFAKPFDLANSLGLSVEQGIHQPELRAALDRILAAAKAAGKKAGIYCSSASIAKECSDIGFHMVSCMTDATALPEMARQSLDVARGGS
ncbi:hypothetical protein CEP53_012812 [Fusarium sp. AF-6]|nr:hypothetical protein CEP53_012812 [Fusarium sp. AF-6]